ncbi:MAG: succinate dehydrogenase/fumarate reductase transmembrane subunit [Dehalococcoidia bacterium]
MEDKGPLQNYLGIRGWIWAGNYKLERYLYLLHRITGLGLLLFGLFHMTATTIFRVQGESVWTGIIAFLDNPLFKVGEFLVVAAFSYHALNGLRLIIQELGFALGKPVPPIYPFTDAIRRKRAWTLVTLAAIMVLAVAFFIDFSIGGWG